MDVFGWPLQEKVTNIPVLPLVKILVALGDVEQGRLFQVHANRGQIFLTLHNQKHKLNKVSRTISN